MCSAPWDHPLHGPTKCGQCMECRLAYSREWAIRMDHERQMHTASCFLTLTYSQANLPPHGQLVKKDLQRFFRRLWKHKVEFRYVACGEYGELGRRPHFHVALFGLDFAADRVFYKNGSRGDPLYLSPTLSKYWPEGIATLGELTFESCAYIARYVTKKIKGPGASKLPLACDPESGELIMPEDEFLIMSRNPGIGSAWFDKYFKSDVFPHGRVITAQGTPAPVPSFYKRKLNAMDAHTMRKLVYESQDKVPVSVRRNEDSPSRRRARSEYAKSRTGVFKRDTDKS